MSVFPPWHRPQGSHLPCLCTWLDGPWRDRIADLLVPPLGGCLSTEGVKTGGGRTSQQTKTPELATDGTQPTPTVALTR